MAFISISDSIAILKSKGNPQYATLLVEMGKVSYRLILILTLAVLFLGILGLSAFSLYRTNQSGSNITPTRPPLSSEFACSQDSDCVVGIQATSCCSCPEAINKEVIGTKDWEQYELGKDYSPQQLKSCGGAVACSPCEMSGQPICSGGKCQFSLGRGGQN